MGSEISFQDIAQLVRDVVHPNDVGDVPYIGLEHIEQGTLRLAGWGRATEVNSAKFRFRKGDVLFGKLRPYFRKVIRAPFDGVCSTDIWVVRARAGFDQGYLFYWMAAQDFVDFASSGSEGTRMPRAKWEHVAQFTRPRLSLPEQRAIARILGTLDDKIELNRRMNETLEAMAQALFKSWFVDFDPVVVNALRAGNPIPEKFAARAAHYRDNPDALGLPEDILRLFPARFVDSELDPIPEGWEVKALPDIVDIVLGGTPKTSIAEYWGGEVLWASAKDISNTSDIFITKTERTITRFGLEKSNAKLLPAGTTVITSRGTVGKLCILGVDMAINQTNYGLVSHLDVDKYFVYLAMNNLISTLKQHSHGTIFETITTETLSGVKIVYPRKEVMDIFSSIVSYFMDNIYCNILESQTLAALRDALLPKLISGELRVKDVEKILEDAV